MAWPVLIRRRSHITAGKEQVETMKANCLSAAIAAACLALQLERGLFALMLASALLPGCALQRVDPEPLPAPERVAIIAARSAPEPAFNLHARSRGEAATVRGGQGMLKGAASGALAPAHLALHTAAACARLQRQRVSYLPHVGPAGSWSAPDYRALGGDFDAVLELGVTAIGFQGSGGEAPTAALEMQLRARLVPLDGSHARLLHYTHTGAPHPVAAWQADDGRLFQDELGAAYGGLAQRVAEESSAPRPAPHAWRVLAWSPPPAAATPAPAFSFPSSWSPSGTTP